MAVYTLRNGNVCRSRRDVLSDVALDELLDILAVLRAGRDLTEPDWCHGKPCYTRTPKPEYL